MWNAPKNEPEPLKVPVVGGAVRLLLRGEPPVTAQVESVEPGRVRVSVPGPLPEGINALVAWTIQVEVAGQIQHAMHTGFESGAEQLIVQLAMAHSPSYPDPDFERWNS